MKVQIQIILLLLTVAVSNVKANVYLYIHRSNSSFETTHNLFVQVNYEDVASIRPGEWKLIMLEDQTRNFVVNIRFPEGASDDPDSPCEFPRQLISTSSDSIQFITLSDEFCDMRILPRARSLSKLEKGGYMSGFRLKGRETVQMDSLEVRDLTKQLVGIDLDPIDRNLLPDDIDSLRLLALEALRLRKELAEKQRAIRQKLEEYYELMKAFNQLDQGVQPIVHLGMEQGGLNQKGEMTYNIRATYSYDIVDQAAVKAELVHYPSGKYRLQSSAAAMATAFAMKKSIEDYMNEYFEPGSLVSIRIIGSADASPIFTPLTYKGEYNALDRHEFELVSDYQIIVTQDPEMTKEQLENEPGYQLMRQVAGEPESLQTGESFQIDLQVNDKFQKNEELAYLRSLGIKNYMLVNIPSLLNTKNRFIMQTKLEESIGGIFRKVVIEFVIEDILRDK
ncbi:MAG: hypothetical protein Roseis2KO_42640 [Roseivirga sp.]